MSSVNDFGVFLIDKPVGITSFDVIRKLRKTTEIRKMGHSRTLDPFADGLLPVLVGKATKIANFLLADQKEYSVSARLGIKTDSGDITGKIVAEQSVPELSEERILAAAEEMLSLKTQIPPPYSAKKINGKRAYELARQNIDFELQPQPIRILSFEIIEIKIPIIRYKTTVSKGVYIRALTETFAEKLRTIAMTSELRRTKIGNLSVEQSVPLEKVTVENWRNFLLPLPDILADFPKIEIAKSQMDFFRNGRPLAVEFPDIEKIMVLDENIRCLGFAEISEGWLKPKIVLI